MNQEKIGKFIQELRKEKGLTQEELAEKLGITKNAVSKWERGISLMDLSLLKPLSEILDVSITEILSGDRIDDKSLKNVSEEVVKNTVEYSDKKIKKSRIKNIIFSILLVVGLMFVCFLSYKLFLLDRFSLDEPDIASEVAEGFRNKKELKIYKRTIDEDDYFVLGNFKIRNDFKECKLDKRNSEMEPFQYICSDSKFIFSSLKDEVNYQFIDNFVRDDLFFMGEGTEGMNENFVSADRKYFLLKNDINNDIDYFEYIGNNYFIKNNIFMSKREIMENYSFNLFTSIAIPKVDKYTVITGDYLGYIWNINKTTQVTIIRDDRMYGFYTNDKRFLDEEYLKDILGTIEII